MQDDGINAILRYTHQAYVAIVLKVTHSKGVVLNNHIFAFPVTCNMEVEFFYVVYFFVSENYLGANNNFLRH